MRVVQRSEIIDYVTYNEQRAQIRSSALAAKRLRRVVVADCLTFLFENHETIRYQILEMMRVEQIVRERDILHEIETYNELLRHGGELGATVLISAAPKERAIVDAINRHMTHSAVDLSRAGTTLGALKEIVRRCDLMVTNDTGPRHIAAAFDVPVVTVFGPTHPEWTEIYYAKERQVAVKVFCGPCQKKVCPLDHRCMTRVTPGMVYARAMELLGGGASRVVPSAGVPQPPSDDFYRRPWAPRHLSPPRYRRRQSRTDRSVSFSRKGRPWQYVSPSTGSAASVATCFAPSWSRAAPTSRSSRSTISARWKPTPISSATIRSMAASPAR